MTCSTGTSIIFALLAVAVASNLIGCKRLDETVEKAATKNPSQPTNCIKSTGDNYLYTTAAKFQLAIPKWALNFKQENHFNQNCELESIILQFGWVDGRLIPMPYPGISPPAEYKLPDRYEPLTLMIAFKSKELVAAPDERAFCRNKNPKHAYEAYNVIVCPYLRAEKSAHIPTLPFYPRFELIEDRDPPASFTCNHSQLSRYTIDNLHELDITESCRGYWKWRPGAYVMFDLHEGKIVQKAFGVIKAAERIMESWVVAEPK